MDFGLIDSHTTECACTAGCANDTAARTFVIIYSYRQKHLFLFRVKNVSACVCAEASVTANYFSSNKKCVSLFQPSLLL